jgi:hypothetical protein
MLRLLSQVPFAGMVEEAGAARKRAPPIIVIPRRIGGRPEYGVAETGGAARNNSVEARAGG